MEQTIWLVRGTDKTIKVYVRDVNGAPYNLTGCTGYLTVKLRKEDTTAKATKSTATTGQGAIVSAEGGKMEFYLSASDSATWVPDSYVYDIQVATASPSSKRYSVVSMSRLEVSYDIG
jgi:hypothetical protein